MKKSLGAKTLVYPAPVFVVGTYDPQGKPNVMTAAWGGICCSRPPCVAVSLRKATYTCGNIVARKAFTISIPSEAHVQAVDHFGLVSGRDVDKFAAAKLTPVRSDLVDAPYVKEFPMVVECRLVHTIELGLHTQFVGEVVDVKVDEAVLASDGTADLRQVWRWIEPKTAWTIAGRAAVVGFPVTPASLSVGNPPCSNRPLLLARATSGLCTGARPAV